MTTDIEKNFFDTFGIEQRHKCTDGALEPCNEQCNECGYYELRYPPITDRILLELLRICLNNDFVIHSKDLAELKEKVLYLLIRNKTLMLQGRIQTIFKGE